MAFRFPLAAVLLLRREHERSAERALVTLQRELNVVHGQLDAIRSELSRIANERAAAAAQRMQGVALHEQYARRGVLEEARLELQDNVAAVKARLEAQQITYTAARRARELLEEMETEQRSRFRAAAAVREQKRADELFLMRRSREH